MNYGFLSGICRPGEVDTSNVAWDSLPYTRPSRRLLIARNAGLGPNAVFRGPGRDWPKAEWLLSGEREWKRTFAGFRSNGTEWRGSTLSGPSVLRRNSGASLQRRRATQGGGASNE